MTTPAPETPLPQIVLPTAEEARAISQAAELAEIRALAQELFRAGQLGFDPTTLIKGIVTAIDLDGSPPTLSITVGGDTATVISDVRLLNNYSPMVGHTIMVAKQGSQIVVLGHIAELSAYTVSSGAGGWNRASLAAGSHGGNENGDVYYRRILDHGSWKMQWRGGWNVSGTTMISSLAAEFRPSSRRTVLAARNADAAISVKIDFDPSGSVTLVGANTGTTSASSSGDVWTVDPIDSTTTSLSGYLSQGGSDLGHSHGVVGGHDHGFTGGSHSHSVPSPTWVSLNGIEYFL